jgi:hypothetical protein
MLLLLMMMMMMMTMSTYMFCWAMGTMFGPTYSWEHQMKQACLRSRHKGNEWISCDAQSIDCMYWWWENFPFAWQGLYKGHIGEYNCVQWSTYPLGQKNLTLIPARRVIQRMSSEHLVCSKLIWFGIVWYPPLTWSRIRYGRSWMLVWSCTTWLSRVSALLQRR